MTASSIDLTQAVLCLREPPRGLVRHDGEPGEYNLHFTLPGRQSLSGRRPLHILGRLRSSVRLPSSYHSPLKSPEDQGLPRHHGDSDRLTALVSTVASPTTTTPPTSSHSADRHGSIQYFPNIRRPQFHREPHWLDLAAWLLYQGYPKTAGFPNFCRGHGGWSITLFLQSRLYFSLESLCQVGQWQRHPVPGPLLCHSGGIPCSYLRWNKQVDTIKVHRATFASVLKMINPPTAIQEVTIHSIIRWMTILRPRTPEVLPRWHLSVVLKGLMKPPFAINGSDRNISLELLPY